MVSEMKSKVELRGRRVMELEQEQELIAWPTHACHRVGALCCADVKCSHAVLTHPYAVSPNTLQQRAQVNARNDGLEERLIPLFQYSVEEKRVPDVRTKLNGKQ